MSNQITYPPPLPQIRKTKSSTGKIIGIMFASIIGIVFMLIISAFLVIKDKTGYDVKDGKMVYKHIPGPSFKTLYRQMNDADPKTFDAFGFSKVYGKDESHVYLEGFLIRDADPQSFKILEGLYKYARDENYLYGRTKKIGNNPDSFEFLGEGYAKDNKHAFKQGRIIEGADGSTFELMDEKGMLAKDNRHVFYFGKLIEGAQSPNFQHLEYGFYTDQNHVFHNSKMIKEINFSDFEILGDRYSKNSQYVFYETKIIESADPNSFVVVKSGGGDCYAEDKNQKYNYDMPIEKFPSRIKK